MRRFERYINGNYMVTIDTQTGTKIRENNLDYFDAEFPESFDLNITNCCDGGCPWCYQGCTPNGKHADLLSAKFFDTIHPFTEIAINGNDLSHPQLVEFLQKMRSKNIIVSMTVNQKHFMKRLDFIKYLIHQKLIHGLGISLTDSYNKDFIREVQMIPSAVIHMIAGVHTLQDFTNLSYNNLKILILGYKTVGRGADYVKEPYVLWEVGNRIEELENYLNAMINYNFFDVISFDNRAIKQLHPDRCMSEENWKQIYMGDDGIDGEMTSASMYIDLVSGKFARNSCEAERYDLMDNITDMYQFLKRGNRNE